MEAKVLSGTRMATKHDDANLCAAMIAGRRDEEAKPCANTVIQLEIKAFVQQIPISPE